MANEAADGSVGWYSIRNVLFRRDRDPVAQREKERAKQRRLQEKDPLYWTRGRLVAIRPDGARKSLDPEKLRLIRTPEEHEDAVLALRAFWGRLQRRVRDEGREFRPEWAMEQAAEHGLARGLRQSSDLSPELGLQQRRSQTHWPPDPR
jgi:hypothetical protein